MFKEPQVIVYLILISHPNWRELFFFEITVSNLGATFSSEVRIYFVLSYYTIFLLKHFLFYDFHSN